MTIPVRTLGLTLAGLTFTAALAQDTTSPGNPSNPNNPKDYADLSKLVQKMVVEKMPKQFSDNSAWGTTIPAPEKLPFPRLRTYVKVGDRVEVPHGLWRKARVWIDDPAKDVKLEITNIKQSADMATRVSVDTTVFLQGEGELQHWQKGLATIGITARATSTVLFSLDVDVKISLDASKFPPELQVEPKVVESKVDIKEFELFKPNQGVGGDRAGQLNGDIKNALQQLARGMEPEIKTQANQAIAQSLKDGKATISAASLFKGLGGAKGN